MRRRDDVARNSPSTAFTRPLPMYPPFSDGAKPPGVRPSAASSRGDALKRRFPDCLCAENDCSTRHAFFQLFRLSLTPYVWANSLRPPKIAWANSARPAKGFRWSFLARFCGPGRETYPWRSCLFSCFSHFFLKLKKFAICMSKQYDMICHSTPKWRCSPVLHTPPGPA